MKKEYLIKTLKLNIELLEKLDLPEDFTLYHTIDRGRSIDDPEKIVDFDLEKLHCLFREACKNKKQVRLEKRLERNSKVKHRQQSHPLPTS